MAERAPLADEQLPYQMISRGEAAGPYQAFPDVCRLPGGDLLCVFYAGYGHVSLPSDEWPRGGRMCTGAVQRRGAHLERAASAVRRTAGRSRSAHRRHARRHAVVQLLSVPQGRRQDRVRHLPGRLARRRPNLGYRAPRAGRRIAGPSRRRCASCPTARCCLGVYTADDSTAYGAVLRSTDGGKTWSEPIAIDPDSGVRLDAETDVIQLVRRPVVGGAARRPREHALRHQPRRRASPGRKWRDIGFAGHCPHLTRLSSGEILLSHRLPGTRRCTSAATTAQSWQGPFAIDRSIGAYASTVELKDHTVLVVYYEEGHTAARSAPRGFASRPTASKCWAGNDS